MKPVPRPAQALEVAAKPTDVRVIPLFPATPAATLEKEIPAYLRFSNVEDYRLYQYGVQRALLEANLAKRDKSISPQHQVSDNTWHPMQCPWAVAGRTPKP